MAQVTSASRPKRTGDDFARAHEQTTKKPRFDYRNPSTLAPDAPEEDVILDADVIGKGGRQIKRNAVNIDGYESDSDNDNFNARAAEREKAGAAKNGQKKSQDEEDDDMFADLEEGVQGTASGDEDEDVAREGKQKKKDVRFLDQTEIEGQVMNSTSGGHVSSSLHLHHKGKRPEHQSEESDSSSGEDSDRDLPPDPEEMEPDLAAEVGAGAKKKHAPRLDAFNLRDEEEEGRFDEAGNYVRKAADPDAANDTWLDGLSKKDMKRAREAQERRDEEQRRKTAESDALLSSDLLSVLILHLETGETALEALQRLNKGKAAGERKVPKWKLKKSRNGMDVDDASASAAEDPAEVARRKALEAITGAADALYTRENHEIYDTERELLMRQYRRETGDDWEPPAPTNGRDHAGQDSRGADAAVAQAMWEYRWSDARDGGEHHGPYDVATMKAWNHAGYFGEGVEFRKVGGGTEWDRILDVD